MEDICQKNAERKKAEDELRVILKYSTTTVESPNLTEDPVKNFWRASSHLNNLEGMISGSYSDYSQKSSNPPKAWPPPAKEVSRVAYRPKDSYKLRKSSEASKIRYQALQSRFTADNRIRSDLVTSDSNYDTSEDNNRSGTEDLMESGSKPDLTLNLTKTKKTISKRAEKKVIFNPHLSILLY